MSIELERVLTNELLCMCVCMHAAIQKMMTKSMNAALRIPHFGYGDEVCDVQQMRHAVFVNGTADGTVGFVTIGSNGRAV